MRFYLAAQISNLRKRFYDNFSLRSNTSGSLGTATDGSRWKAINGVIQVVSGKAKSLTTPGLDDSGSSYPMAVVDMPTTDNIIEITDTLQGSAAALWVQSSTDWWLVDVDSTFNTIPGNSVYGIVGSNYSTLNSNYGKVGDNYGVVGANYQTTGSNYVTVNSNYGDSGDNYGATGTNYGATGSNYGAVGSNFGKVGDNFGVANTNYTSFSGYTLSFTSYGFAYTPVTNYATGNSNYQDTGDNYGAVGSNFGAVGSNFGAVGSNYGKVGDNYGVVGSNYAVTGSNYGTVSSNYGDTGDNYGAVGSNYTTVSSNYGVTGTNAATYAFAQYLRIKQSSAGAVNTITSALISASQTVNSLLVQLSGNQITAKAYSDPNLVTQIGSDLVYTATGATVTTTFGIAISPSSYNQSDEVGSSVNITRS